MVLIGAPDSGRCCRYHTATHATDDLRPGIVSPPGHYGQGIPGRLLAFKQESECAAVDEYE